MINIPDCCLPLLKEHRTHYKGDFAEAYSAELQATYEGIKAYLPSDGNILDIGCGMAGIDILLDRHYGGEEKITLLDKQGKADTINAGFHQSAETFAHYHDFALTIKMLSDNGVGYDGEVIYGSTPSIPRPSMEIIKPKIPANVKFIDINAEKFPRKQFNVVISLLSWGFHYPIDTYQLNVKKGGIIVADVRRGTDGIKQLSEYGAVTVVHNALKYQRVVVQC